MYGKTETVTYASFLYTAMACPVKLAVLSSKPCFLNTSLIGVFGSTPIIGYCVKCVYLSVCVHASLPCTVHMCACIHGAKQSYRISHSLIEFHLIQATKFVTFALSLFGHT